MTEIEILNGNKLIAEFITEEPEVLKRDLCKAGILDCMRYSSSWDWLMPVVDKIELSGFEVRIEGISCKINRVLEKDNTIIQLVCGDKSNKIGLVYQAVIEFIDWYDKNK